MEIWAVLAMLIIACLLLYIVICQKDRKIEVLQSELSAQKQLFSGYDELIRHIRFRQHDFVNHLTTILGLHIVCKSYDELVRMQMEYSQTILDDNKHSKLLKLGGNALTGFLHQKLIALEQAGNQIELGVNSAELPRDSNVCCLVKVLGILLDNAAEAPQTDGRKNKIVLFSSETDKEYLFAVQNRYIEVSYSEMANWFRLNKSSKGRDRGIGLHWAKKICDENGYQIRIRKFVSEDENWIEFIVVVPK